MLYLPSVKTFVYTIIKNKERQYKIINQLNELGFTNWEFVIGSTGRAEYWKNIHDDWITLLNTDTPFLILEDDAEYTEAYKEYINFPPSADIVYLGGTTNAVEHQHILDYLSAETREKLKESSQEPNTCGGLGTLLYTEYDDTYIQTYNMHSTHAVLFLNQDIHQKLQRAIRHFSELYPVDVVLALESSKNKVFCVKQPFWYQNDNHNSIFTSKYYP